MGMARSRVILGVRAFGLFILGLSLRRIEDVMSMALWDGMGVSVLEYVRWMALQSLLVIMPWSVAAYLLLRPADRLFTLKGVRRG